MHTLNSPARLPHVLGVAGALLVGVVVPGLALAHPFPGTTGSPAIAVTI